MKKYGIIQGETSDKPVKTASDKIIDEVNVDLKGNQEKEDSRSFSDHSAKETPNDG